jgi:hypothetical protein
MSVLEHSSSHSPSTSLWCLGSNPNSGIIPSYSNSSLQRRDRVANIPARYPRVICCTNTRYRGVRMYFPFRNGYCACEWIDFSVAREACI